MSNNKYEFLKKHKAEIFEMIWDTLDNAPNIDNYSCMSTEEINRQYQKDLDEYFKNRTNEIKDRLTKMGFEFNN